MQLFYTSNIQGDYAYLPEPEARHCVQVLRHRPGDIVQLIDGVGGYYSGEIVEATKKTCVLRILTNEQAYKKRSYKVQLIIAPPKNITRFEWLLEKVTEIGIDDIKPVICQRSERKRIREDRLERILLSATKQSGQAYLPQLHNLQNVIDVLDVVGAWKGDKLIAHCGADDLPLLQQKYQPGKDVSIMIGPEGDFSKPEITAAVEAGFAPISLGPHRLRTETAGLMACHSIHLLNTIE